MWKLVLISLASIFALGFLPHHALAEETSSLSCQPGYALRIDVPPQPSDDPAQASPGKPMTAAEKEQTEQQAKADELNRWHCVPLNAVQPADAHQ